MELNHKILGQGPPLIILHGMFGTLDNWQGIARQLAEEYTIYLIDQRNHGRSEHSEEFSYEILAQDLHEFMQSHWLHRAHVLGHSMGGKVAMRFACEYGDMVQSLIVADIAPKAYVGNHQAIFKALLGINLETVSSRQEVQDYLQSQLDDQSVLQFLLKNLYPRKEGGYAWRMNVPVIHAHYAEILGQDALPGPYEGPTLFLYGEKSHYVNPQEKSLYQTFFPDLEMQGIAQAGHWLHADAPQAFVQYLRDFLQRRGEG